MVDVDDSYLAELGLHVSGDGDVVRGRAEISPELCVPGTSTLRTSVLAVWGDIVAGFVGGQAISPRVPLTLDLEVQVLAGASSGDRVEVEATAVKVGRTVVVCEARFRSEIAGTPVAVAFASFVASPDPAHVFPDGFPLPTMQSGRLVMPLAARVGATTIAPGVVEVPRRPDGLNASGGIQGGVIALAAEDAARSLTDSPATLGMLNVRYLRQFSIGPARAVAEGHGSSVIIRVTDVGSGRLSAIATARVPA
jgi:acyl-coenzyme A thioesterase PaaI-like protein